MQGVRKNLSVIKIFIIFIFFAFFQKAYSLPSDKAFSEKLSDIRLIPCGNAIGININSDGLLAVGFSEILDFEGKMLSPAEEAGIKSGDFLTHANGIVLESVAQFSEIINGSDGSELKIVVTRGNLKLNLKVRPAKTPSGDYKIGLWVRDGAAGIGTLTYYNPQTQEFGSLGHPISDSETGSIFKIRRGEIYSCSILSSVKGEHGRPGELKGVFDGDSLGIITKNSKSGIFGKLVDDERWYNQGVLPVASRFDVRVGDAYILSTVDSAGVRRFAIRIQRVIKQNASISKGLIIKVTDKALLDQTGGIVQGMSGSPIIQDGRLVGAVTHVFVNDPTRGYGIFIENMLNSN